MTKESTQHGNKATVTQLLHAGSVAPPTSIHLTTALSALTYCHQTHTCVRAAHCSHVAQVEEVLVWQGFVKVVMCSGRNVSPSHP